MGPSPGADSLHTLFDAHWHKEQKYTCIWFRRQHPNRFFFRYIVTLNFGEGGWRWSNKAHILPVIVDIWFWKPYLIISVHFKLITFYNSLRFFPIPIPPPPQNVVGQPKMKKNPTRYVIFLYRVYIEFCIIPFGHLWETPLTSSGLRKKKNRRKSNMSPTFVTET